MQRSENRGRIDATLQPRRNQFRTDGSNVARQPQGMSTRLAFPSRRNHITQKIRIGGRTLYLSVHDDQAPAEIFLRVKGDDCTPEAIALSDVIARVMSIALQYGAPLKKVGDLLIGASGRRSHMISKLNRWTCRRGG